MEDLNNIGEQINKAISDTAAENNYGEIEKERLDVERQRIKSEERIAERLAERDENVAEIQHDASYYRTMLDELLGKLDFLVNTNNPANQIPQSIEVNTGDSEIPDSANEDKEEFEEAEPNESVEEIGDENENEEISEPPADVEDNNGNRRIRRKRGRR